MILPYLIHLAIIVCIFIILALSLNLAVGYTGLLNLGHVAFFGIGAYASALLVINGIPFWLAFLLAGVFASIFGFLLILATKKLKGDYFALACLGFSFVVYSILLNWNNLTRGPLGIPGIPKPNFFGLIISNNIRYLLFILIVTLLVVLFVWRLVNSSYGRVLGAVRDDEIGASVLGKNAFKIKWQIMMISAFLAGIGGSLYAHYITFIDPSSFVLAEMIFLMTIIIVGGLASWKGTILASIVLLLIPEMLRFLALPSSILGPLRQILFGLILLGILLFKPKGFSGNIILN